MSIKDDEIEFLQYLISKCNNGNGYCQPGRDAVAEYNMNDKRKTYILNKWDNKGLWDYGVSLYSGWFKTENKDEIFKKITEGK